MRKEKHSNSGNRHNGTTIAGYQNVAELSSAVKKKNEVEAHPIVSRAAAIHERDRKCCKHRRGPGSCGHEATELPSTAAKQGRKHFRHKRVRMLRNLTEARSRTTETCTGAGSIGSWLTQCRNHINNSVRPRRSQKSSLPYTWKQNHFPSHRLRKG